MRYSYFLHFLVVSIILSPILVIAIDTKTSGRILDTFKKEEYELLFETIPFDNSGSHELLEHEYLMSGLDGLKTKLTAMQEVYSVKKGFMTEKRLNLEAAIGIIEGAIHSTESEIVKIQTDIESKQTNIQQYTITSLELKKKTEKNKQIILSYLANIYSESNVIFDASNSVDLIQGLILSSESTDTIITDITYKSLVSVLGQRFIDEYRSLIQEYYRISIRMDTEIQELESLQDQLSVQKSNLENQKNEREKILTVTKWQEELFQKYIDSQKQAQEMVEKSWQNANEAYTASLEKMLKQNGCSKEQKIEDSLKCDRIIQFYENEKLLRKTNISTGTVNVFDWPVTSRTISTFFRDAGYYSTLSSHHDAIDIASPQGSDVTAPLDGYVYYILPPAPGGYSYLALKHPNGYVTVYGHLSEILVTPYKFVKKWELIAKSGGAPGTPGAWPMTSGAHLHFEVWQNKNPIDPLRVLSIASVEYTTLLAKYQDKFIADFTESFGTGADISKYERKFILRGDNEEARQKYLLKTYATPDFQDWSMWVNTALDARIDPSFMMCVGLSETTLGNNLKTPYNIGNVGNTDDGGTYTFTSPSEGLSWMTKTFNNKFLGKYKTIDELSRWGNTTGSIYASSNGNWHNNLVRCLSALKWRFVEDTYPFRMK